MSQDDFVFSLWPLPCPRCQPSWNLLRGSTETLVFHMLMFVHCNHPSTLEGCIALEPNNNIFFFKRHWRHSGDRCSTLKLDDCIDYLYIGLFYCNSMLTVSRSEHVFISRFPSQTGNYFGRCYPGRAQRCRALRLAYHAVQGHCLALPSGPSLSP